MTADSAHNENAQRKWDNWEKRALDPHRNRDRLPPLPAYLGIGDTRIAQINRFMRVIPFPWLDRSRGAVEWGVACNGCRIQHGTVQAMSLEELKKAMAPRQALYSQKGYLVIFLNCSGYRRSSARTMLPRSRVGGSSMSTVTLYARSRAIFGTGNSIRILLRRI
jgi:hypothetical protein